MPTTPPSVRSRNAVNFFRGDVVDAFTNEAGTLGSKSPFFFISCATLFKRYLPNDYMLPTYVTWKSRVGCWNSSKIYKVRKYSYLYLHSLKLFSVLV